MRIVTEIYADDGFLENRSEQIFCDRCNKEVDSIYQLFSCVRYVVKKNPEGSYYTLFNDQLKVCEEKFKCCLVCRDELINKTK
jgi:hypothetical protein